MRYGLKLLDGMDWCCEGRQESREEMLINQKRR